MHDINVNIASIACTCYTAATPIDTLMLASSPTVTQSPVMMGENNVAAVVAIPAVLLLLLVIGVAVVCVGTGYYYLCYRKRQGLNLSNTK